MLIKSAIRGLIGYIETIVLVVIGAVLLCFMLPGLVVMAAGAGWAKLKDVVKHTARHAP